MASSIQGSSTPVDVQPRHNIDVLQKPGGRGKLSGQDVQVVSGLRLDAPVRKLAKPKPGLSGRTVVKNPGPVNLKLRHEARYKALPSSERLIEKAGRPKNDINFGIFGTKKMSTGYKAILNGLDQYHTSLNSDTKVGRGQLQELRDHLETLKGATDKYQDSKSHTRKTAMGDMHRQIGSEIRLLDRLLQDADKGVAWPDGVSLKDGLTFARQGKATADLAATLAQDLVNSSMSKEALQPYRDAGFSGHEARLLEQSGLNLKGGLMYRAANLKVTPETLPGNLRSNNETGFKKLGAGAMNTVFEVRYNSTAGNKVGVFKPLPNIDAGRVEKGWVAGTIGVDNRNPQTAMRNIGTVAVAKALGFDVVPDTTIAEHDGQLGLLMDKATGTAGRKTDATLFKDPDVRRELTKLQVLDALVGQGDRHSNNYFINKDKISGAVTITGVDNDQCFGRKLDDPNGIAQGTTSETKGFRGVKLPPVMDSDMAKALLDMKPTDLDRLLGDKLTPSEVGAVKTRLTKIQTHVRDLQSKGNIIGPGDWGGDKVGQLLDKTNSYVARDGARADRIPQNTEEQRLHDNLVLLGLAKND